MNKQPNSLHTEIAHQVAHMKPDHLVPGKHVGMEIVDEKTLRVGILTDEGVNTRIVEIEYDEGPDTYKCRVIHRPDQYTAWTMEPQIENVFCDDLGEIVFQDEAKPWTMPHGEIVSFGPDGEIERQEF